MSHLKSLLATSKWPRARSGRERRLGGSSRSRPTIPLYQPRIDGTPAQRTACLLALNVLLLSVTVLSHPLWTSCVAALVLTVTLVWLLELPAAALGLVDKPHGRKTHDCVTPLTGGPAILFAAAIVMLSGWWPATILPFLMVTGLIGAVDDRRGLSARMRLGAMTAILVAMVYVAGHGVTDLGNLFGFGPIELGAAGSLAFTILCGVGLVNAINMADGVDGLAAAHVASSLTALLLAAWLSTGTFPPELPVIIAAVVGFLVVNSRHPFNARAQAFLGDSGSMILGVCLAWYAISLSQGEQRALPPAAVLWILGLPVIDTLRVMVQRQLRRVSPFFGARDHLHHILQARGMTPAATTCTLAAVNIAFCTVGVLGAHFGIPEPVLTYSFITVALLFWTLTPRSPFIGYCGRDVSECPKAVVSGCELATACDDGHPNPR